MSVNLKSCDIVKNLPSLDFELGLSDITDDPKSLLPLRLKSYAHTLTICSQSVFIISLLTEALEVAIKQSAAVSVNYKVGFIGCGRLGTLMIKCLLHFKVLEPSHIYISTRRPELLKELSKAGVVTCFNNSKVASSCQLLCLCCLPSQLSMVAESLRGHLSPATLVYSIVGGVTLQRHCQLLHTNSVLRPTFTWPNSGWTVECIESYTAQVTKLVQKEEVIKLTCPQPLTCDPECLLVTRTFLAVLNTLTSVGIGKELAVRICTTVMFGQADCISQLLDALTADKLMSADKRSLQLPLLPLNRAATTSLDHLMSSPDMYKRFTDKYKLILSPDAG